MNGSTGYIQEIAKLFSPVSQCEFFSLERQTLFVDQE